MKRYELAFIREHGHDYVALLQGIFRFLNLDTYYHVHYGLDTDGLSKCLLIGRSSPYEPRLELQQRYATFLQEARCRTPPLLRYGYHALVPLVLLYASGTRAYLFPPIIRITEIDIGRLRCFLETRMAEITGLIHVSLQAYRLTEVYDAPVYTVDNPPNSFVITPRPNPTSQLSVQDLENCRQMAWLFIEIGIASKINFVFVLTPTSRVNEVAFTPQYTSTVEINHEFVHDAFQKKEIYIPANNGGSLVLYQRDFNPLTWCYIAHCIQWDRPEHALTSLLPMGDRGDTSRLPHEYQDPVLGKTARVRILVCMKDLPTVHHDLATLISCPDRPGHPSASAVPRTERYHLMPVLEGLARLEENIRSVLSMLNKLPEQLLIPPAELPVKPTHSHPDGDASAGARPSFSP